VATLAAKNITNVWWNNTTKPHIASMFHEVLLKPCAPPPSLNNCNSCNESRDICSHHVPNQHGIDYNLPSTTFSKNSMHMHKFNIHCSTSLGTKIHLTIETQRRTLVFREPAPASHPLGGVNQPDSLTRHLE
jgi:hypothetical protein